MKYIALAKTVLVTIWLRQVVAREDGIRGMNSNTNQEEKVQRLKESRECVRYNSKVLFQVNNLPIWVVSDKRWLTGGRDRGNDSVYLRNYLDGGYEQRHSETYLWTVRSESGDGNRDDPDPKSRDCVAYNDKVFLQVNNLNNRWLTGGRGFENYDVETRNILLYEKLMVNSPYQWIVRSESGDGRREDPDPLAGRPVIYSDAIFLQVNHVNNRWLAGRKGTHDIYVMKTVDWNHDRRENLLFFSWTVLNDSGDRSPWTSQVTLR